MFSTGYYNRCPRVLNSKYPQVGGSSGGGGGRAGFVNRLIGAIFASLVCHCVIQPSARVSPKSQTSGALRGLYLSLSLLLGQLAEGCAAWSVDYQPAGTGLGPRGICSPNSNGRVHLMSWVSMIWWKTNKERRGQRGEPWSEQVVAEP